MARRTVSERAVRKELQRAAKPTLKTMKEEAARLKKRGGRRAVLKMLGYIRAHLFDLGLTVNSVTKACGIRDNSASIHFHAMVGVPPGAYIRERRIAVSRRLLSTTDLPVWQVAELMGYSSIQVFSRVFRHVVGIRPSVYRKTEVSPVEEEEEGPVERLDFLRRVLTGRAPSHEVLELIAELSNRYADQQGPAKSGPVGGEEPAERLDHLRRVLAGHVSCHIALGWIAELSSCYAESGGATMASSEGTSC